MDTDTFPLSDNGKGKGEIMRIGMLYFSGTGLTSELSRLLEKEFKSRGHRVERIRFAEGKKMPEFDRYDMLGVGAPTFSFYPPRIFLRFLRGLSLPKGMSYFLFVTSHGMPGITAPALDRACREKGLRRVNTPIEGKGVNNIRAWRRTYDKRKPKDIFKVEGDISSWVDTSLRGAESDVDEGPLHVNLGLLLFSWLFTWRWEMALVEGLRKKIDRKRCTRCGLCWEIICPSGGIIKTEDGVPKIIHRKCVGCSGCVNLCPSEAIYTNINRNRWPCDLTKKNIIEGY